MPAGKYVRTAEIRAKTSAAVRAAIAARPWHGYEVGTEAVDTDGRVRVKCPDGWRPRAQLVMEDMLGRALIKGEIVHHSNGLAGDDRPENLMLLSYRGDHTSLHQKAWQAARQKQG